MAILVLFLFKNTVSEIILASRYPFSLYLSIILSKSFTYLLLINFEALNIRKTLICFVSDIALRNFLSVNFTFPVKSIFSIFIFFPLSMFTTKFTLFSSPFTGVDATKTFVLK